MRAPGFWSRPPGLAAALLWPASLLWRAAGAWRRGRATPVRAPVPVICVGNLVAGGQGKTPTVIALLEMLTAMGAAPHALSRGHGGTVRGPHRVDPGRDSAAQIGDEPLLLSAWAPAWVSRDRAAGARAAAEAGASVVVMDDGFQNPGLAKDLSLIVIDAATGFGNGRVIPAGPLREPVAAGLARADAVALIGAGPAPEGLGALPVLRARIEPLRTGLSLDGAPVIAFAGIGRPEKFFATLRAQGAQLVAAHAFPDHAAYKPALLRRLRAEALAQGAMLVTTEKDMARLPAWFRPHCAALPVRLRFDDPDWVEALLAGALARADRDSLSN